MYLYDVEQFGQKRNILYHIISSTMQPLKNLWSDVQKCLTYFSV